MSLVTTARISFTATLMLTISLVAEGADPAPKLKVKDLDGQTQLLSQYHSKVVVLNFWATFCGPCQEETPMMIQEEKDYRGRGVVFIGVSMDDKNDIGKVRAFIAEHNPQYPIWMGTVDDLERFKLGPGIPATAFINADGEIVGRVLGEIHKPDLEHRIDWLLGNRQGDPPAALENNLNVTH